MNEKTAMKLTVLIAAVVALSSCAKPLTPKQMAAQAKTCRDNGLVPTEVIQGYSPTPVAIACHLPKPKQHAK